MVHAAKSLAVNMGSGEKADDWRSKNRLVSYLAITIKIHMPRTPSAAHAGGGTFCLVVKHETLSPFGISPNCLRLCFVIMAREFGHSFLLIFLD